MKPPHNDKLSQFYGNIGMISVIILIGLTILLFFLAMTGVVIGLGFNFNPVCKTPTLDSISIHPLLCFDNNIKTKNIILKGTNFGAGIPNRIPPNVTLSDYFLLTNFSESVSYACRSSKYNN
jgi:hypothetical protein